MGFDSVVRKLKKCPTVDADLKEALHAYDYCKFLKFITTDWAKKQIENGYEFNFKESYPTYKNIETPVNAELVKFYGSIVDSEDDDESDIAWWCSSGVYLHDIIREKSCPVYEKSYDGYYEITKKSVVQLKAEIAKWEDEHKIIPVRFSYAFKESDDSEISLIPADGIEVELDDGMSKRIYADEELFISSKYCDTDERYAYETLKEALSEIDKLDLKNYYVYYFGGC